MRLSAENTSRNRASGFSLIEMMLVVLVMTWVLASVFAQIRTMQTRSRAEEMKTELQQQGREFIDQMSRDLAGSGYPNERMYPNLPNVPPYSTVQVAAGLVMISPASIIFEGDTDANSTVENVRYTLYTTSAADISCPCIRRSSIAKAGGTSAYAQATNYSTSLQNVVTGVSPFLAAFDVNGAAVNINSGLSLENAADRAAIMSIRTIVVSINLQASYVDPQTKQRPVLSYTTTVKLNNIPKVT